MAKVYIGVPSHIPSVQRGQDTWHTLRGDLPANIGQLEILQVQICKTLDKIYISN